MSSVRTNVLSCLALACALSACSKEPEKAAPDKAPDLRVMRVELAAPPERETPEQDVQNSRRCIQRITSEVRDAWVAPFDRVLDLDFGVQGRDHLMSAIAILGATDSAPVPKARILLDIRATGGKTHQVMGMTIEAEKSHAEWQPFQLFVGAGDPLRVRIEASFVGPEPEGAQGLRLCVALPHKAPSGPAKAAPNVLVISVDTLRADHLSCLGYARPTSPRIDALCAKGVLFERAYSPAPWTLPSYGSLFTGLWPADHRAGIVTQREADWGVDETPASKATEHLRGDVPTLAELFAKRGFTTAAFYANAFLVPKTGLARGFDQYTGYQHNAKNGIDLATQWLDEHADERFFLFVHLMDPHWPYAPPAKYDEMFGGHSIDDMKSWPPDLDDLRKGGGSDALKRTLVDLYDGEIAFTDLEIGRLLDELDKLKLSDDTIVVFHSDHGEEFWEHGSCDHGHSQYDELLHVPLAIVWPKKLQSKRVATRVRTLDLMPTLLDLAGMDDRPQGTAGKSLLPVIDGRETQDRDVLSEGILHGAREIKAWLQGNDKLIASGAKDDLLFDLGRDPKEQKNRAADARDLAAGLRLKLADHHTKALESAKSSSRLDLDPSLIERLRGVGYTGVDDEKSDPPKKR